MRVKIEVIGISMDLGDCEVQYETLTYLAGDERRELAGALSKAVKQICRAYRLDCSVEIEPVEQASQS